MWIENLSLSIEKRRENIVESLRLLEQKYPDYKKEIDDILFYFEEKQLGNSQAYLLRIWESVLRVRRQETEPDLLNKMETFLNELLKDDILKTVDGTKKTVVEYSWLSLAEWKTRTYWRDVTPMIIKTKYAFVWEKLYDDMVDLRKHIHDKTLWSKKFLIDYNDIKLDINPWDTDEEMLEKITIFFKNLENNYSDKFNSIKTIDTTSKDFNKDRKKAWSVILATFNDFRWKFKWQDFSMKISELRDLIDNFMLWTQTWFQIKEWKINLDIKKWDSLDVMVEKILVFIENIQKQYPDKFTKNQQIDAKEILKNMEEEKIYWRDVIAWIDLLQKDYNQSEFPVLQKLKEMLENNKLWEWTNLYFNIGWAILEIETIDSEKAIKNKISTFIWILKQLSDQQKAQNKINEIYWRDIESDLRWYEDVYGSNVDYQMLIMLIESWILWTVKDFKADIEWVKINITPTDSDSIIKQKLVDFIKWLQDQKKTALDKKRFDQAQERIKKMEQWMIDLDTRFKKASKDWQLKDMKIVDLERKVAIYEQEIKNLKSQAQPSSRPSFSRPSYNG